MPNLSSILNDLRVDGHKVRVYFGAFLGSVVMTATVDSTPADQALSLTVTTVSGSASDVYRGFTVRVYRPDGTTLKGVTNIRAIGTISSTSLPIRELGQADIAIAAGDVVQVVNVPFLGDKLPSDDETFAPDGLTYSSQGSAIAPNTRSGGHRIGMVDSGQTYRTEVMGGSDSGNEDPDSGSSGTHFWALLTGTLAFAPGSASSDANPTIRASVGYGLALHTYTDGSNSVSWSQFVCFQVYDSVTTPYRVLDATLDGAEDSGWSSEFETYGYTTLADLPDGTLGALFVRETINGVDTSYGAALAGLSHIKCLGFLHHDDGSLQPSLRRLRFSLQSPWQRLAGLPGFSKVITRATGVDWTTVEGLTVRLGIFHLLHYYSFFTEMFDVIVDSAFLNKAYAQFFLQKLTADAQVRELALGVDARVTNLRHGALSIHTHPAYIPLADRAAVTSTLTLAERDLLRANIGRDHWKTIETFEGRGLTAGSSDNAPLFSRYPGSTPGRGSITSSADRKIWDDQADANERTGRLAAKEDGTFIDANGALQRAVQWTPELFGAYDVFDFNKEYVDTSLGASSNERGIDLSAMRYYVNRVGIRYERGTARVTPTLLTATNAPAGATYVPPATDVAEYTDPDNVPTPPVLPPPRLPPYSGTDVLPTELIVFDSGAASCHVATAWNPDLTSLVYTDRSSGLSGTNLWATADPWNYGRYLAAQTGGIYVNPSPFTGSAWSLLASNLTIFGDASARMSHIAGSINRNGYFAVGAGRFAFAYTTDNGASWNRRSVVGGVFDPTPYGGYHVKFAISPHNNGTQGWIYASVSSTDVGTRGIWKSEDWGNSWTRVWGASSAFLDGNAANIDVPYKKPDGSLNLNNSSQYIETTGGGYFAFSRDAGVTFITSTLLGGYSTQDGWGFKSFTHGADYFGFAASPGLMIVGGYDFDTDTAAFQNGVTLSGWAGNSTHANGYSLHRLAYLMFNPSQPVLVTTVDGGATAPSVALPVGYTGAGYAEWSLRSAA